MSSATKSDKRREYEAIETGYQAVRWHEPAIHELGSKGVVNRVLPEAEDEVKKVAGDVLARIPSAVRRDGIPGMPEVSEPEIMRHYIRLSQETFGYDSGINIGLGTCTMKYSPRINERLVKLPGLAMTHPLQPESTLQGTMELIYGLRSWLCELSGMDEFTFQPRGGGHAVFTNACIIRAYQKARGQRQKDEIITCAVSHPCNAASPATAGFKVITLYPDKVTGDIGLDAVKAAVSERTAGLMLTAPYDTGVFDSELAGYVKVVHDAGGLVSFDQANFNGIMTKLRARDMGADMMHFNLHKTFSTPHGSSGPATGAVGVTRELRPFLPVPIVEPAGGGYRFNYDLPDSIGKVGAYYGVVLNVLKAYAWIMSLGAEGLSEAAEWAVINNNYLMKKLLEIRGFAVAWPNRRKLQEARFTIERLTRETGVTTEEFNQRCTDYGIQYYFDSHEPVIIPEPITPEASESVPKEDIDRFAEVFGKVAEEAYTDPEIVKTAPHRGSVHRAKVDAMQDPKQWAMTWRAYRRKRAGR